MYYCAAGRKADGGEHEEAVQTEYGFTVVDALRDGYDSVAQMGVSDSGNESVRLQRCRVPSINDLQQLSHGTNEGTEKEVHLGRTADFTLRPGQVKV